MREKIEIGGPGEFDGDGDVEAAMRRSLERMTTAEALEIISEMQDAVVAIAAEDATPIEPATQGPSNEAAHALVLLRPKRKGGAGHDGRG